MPSNESNYKRQELVFINSYGWNEAPCLEKIHTHPEKGLTERIEFMNKVVDMINGNKDIYNKDLINL
jgi:hypothetical protein